MTSDRTAPVSPGVLVLTSRVLRALRALNGIYGAGIVALLVASFVIPETLFRALGVKTAPGSDTLIIAMRLIMVAGIAGCPIAHVILQRLLAIVHSVRDGDPFVVQNARRLTTIAWAVLSLELLHLIVGAIAANASSPAQPLDIDWSFSFTPWIAVLLLFVLARVFEQGARMREDLAGTV